MRIIAFSDIHGQQSKKLTSWFDNNPADLLIFAGDLQANQLYDFGNDFIDWLHNLPYPKKIVVFGNHDGHYKITREYVEDKKKYKDIVFLTNEAVIIDDVKIFGSPHSVQFGSWWFMMLDNELAELWKNIPDDTNILVTHGPPFGILDKTVNGANAGSKTLLERIEKLEKLKYHIFGHIHEARGIETIDGKTFMNVALCNEWYRLKNDPAIFDYKK